MTPEGSRQACIAWLGSLSCLRFHCWTSWPVIVRWSERGARGAPLSSKEFAAGKRLANPEMYRSSRKRVELKNPQDFENS
jgi:hypothetical protein